MHITQKELVNRSGVSYASIRGFENSGQIALQKLLDIARVINCLSDFTKLFSNPKIHNLKERYEQEYKK